MLDGACHNFTSLNLFSMGKKRTREADGKEVPPADSNVEMADADSGDDEVSWCNLAQLQAALTLSFSRTSTW